MGTTGESPHETAHRERISILYVTADSGTSDRPVESLEREDDRFDATVAVGASDAFAFLESDGIDCIVAEHDPPAMDGLALLERIRERDETVPVVLIPETGSEALASDAISAGVTEYVQRENETIQYRLLANRIVTAVESTRSDRQRRRQLRAIETAQEGISLLDTNGEFIYVNGSYASCFGYEPDELIGEEWTVLYDDEETTFIREDVIPTVMTEGDWRGETTAIDADGSRVLVDHTLSTTAHGELICTVRDITERKERERELERYETIIEALGDPVYTVDSDGCYAYVNDAYAEMAGYDKSEIVGEHVSVLLDESSVERGKNAVRRLLSDDTDATQQTYEITVTTNDGDRIHCEDHLSLLPLEDGRYRGVAGVVRDITERKARERELEEYETILETIPDEVYTADAEGYLTKVVPPIDSELTTTGYEPEELVGEHVSLVVDDEDVVEGNRKIRELLADEDRTKASFELELITKDGDRFPNETHVAPLPTDEGGDFRGTVGVLRDISERKAREQKLKRQNERLDSFASIVSHDLRNPLNVAQGQLQVARHRCDCDTQHLESVARAHERMQMLIEDILTVAREDEPVTETEPVDLETYARMCWQHVETGTSTLETATDAAIRVDRSRFKRLLENLIRNSVEHGSDHADQETPGEETIDRPEAEVTITIGDLPGNDGFYVEDDGPGIPPEDRDRVFENGYSTTAEGTGFGLAIVDQIAEAHGWSVEITESDDGGARFEFLDVDVCR